MIKNSQLLRVHYCEVNGLQNGSFFWITKITIHGVTCGYVKVCVSIKIAFSLLKGHCKQKAYCKVLVFA